MVAVAVPACYCNYGFTRNYITRKRKTLIPTDKGEKVYDLIKDQKIANVQMTAEWEMVFHQIIYEDYSAKSFNRPEWVKLLETLKRKSSKTNLLLFTKWDRFGRNAGDAYQMINILKKGQCEQQVIEQPLDLSIPENKMMLAIYLAAPEVENDRRTLNTYYGMRRAKKEGRLM
ncbi:hypothetical protein ASG22_05780 [Chryseobacterium sp. Leaf405]|uniref:recombinase family protein n=1 Tax=Chryseobacterium sp. Leaf405 TaxID=1736367 RepID=UPI0006F97377|nr:recombinase family protein [Chryseobacterium sp. Leaf405]KQT26179.1 hypothetical protein ASG22_05780 [Chryseobacterium sp. Leaf405]